MVRIEGNSRFYVQRGNPASGKVGRSDISSLTSISAPYVNSLGMIVTLVIAYDPKKTFVSGKAQRRNQTFDILANSGAIVGSN
jgi:hypothetical protein